MIKILISNTYFPFLLLHDTRCDMNHKSWVTSGRFPRQNLADQTVSTTSYCISVPEQNNPVEQLWEGLAKQFIKLDVVSGIRQGLWPGSGLFLCEFFTYRLPSVHWMLTNKLAAAGIHYDITSWMITRVILWKGNDFPSHQNSWAIGIQILN